MCGYLRIGFIAFIFEGMSLVNYANLLSPNEYEKNHKIMFKYF